MSGERIVLISLCGVDASGKSTQLERLEEHLQERGVGSVRVWTRLGYTRRLEAGKRWLRRLRRPRHGAAAGEARSRVYPQRASGFRSRLARRLWLRVALLDLFLVYAVELRRWRRRRRVVICDRFLWDAAVDLRVNFPDDDVLGSWSWRLLARLAPRPDASLFLLAPPEVSQERAARKERRGRETPELLARRLAAYDEIARASGGEVMDARQPIEALAAAIRARVDALLDAAPAPAQRRGSPSTRSATMLRWISLVPPAMVRERSIRKR